MEDQSGTNTLSRKPGNNWIVSPSVDLLFMANIAWPLLLLPGVSSSVDTSVDFWQIYFLTLPHRWITLFLVAVDPDRRTGHSLLFGLSTLLIALLVVGSYWASVGFGLQAFVCLGFVDYVWNGWHFASQHSGVLGIYSRKAGYSKSKFEFWGVRCFICYAIFRGSSSLLWPQAAFVKDWLSQVDWLAMVIPCMLVFSASKSLRPSNWRQAIPKLVYLLSVLALYSAYLAASHLVHSRLVLCMATAASLFHAVEYLAIVSHYANRRSKLGSTGLMRSLAGLWSTFLAIFMVLLGTIGFWFSYQTYSMNTAWQGLNLWAALTHYFLDGFIWKLRKPETAQALGVNLNSNVQS